MLFKINPSFNRKNQLKLDLSKNILGRDFKLCFSLVYSIKSIKGAIILKQIGRYYELDIKDKIIIINLQNTKIGSYNKSCGPEGVFLINKNNEYQNVEVDEIVFENEIKKIKYDQKVIDKFIPIIPQPTKLIIKDNNVNILNTNFRITNGEDIIKNTQNLISKLNINFSSSDGFPIFFKKVAMNKDEYFIKINKNKIDISFQDYGGKYYATMTLIQIIYFYKYKLPICEIHDKPKYSWRGMHLDCARQFYSIEEIKRILDYMSFFKLNRFHWHLTDNEAWRVEIKKYPELISKGAYRGYNMTIPPFYGSGYRKYGGFYSHEDIKKLIRYAKTLNIEIMPEIDLPAHSWALLQIMPQLRDQRSNVVSEDVGSYKNNTINPSLKTTNKFLKEMLLEICEIFTFDTIHVGLDERPKNSWEGSPSIIKFLRENNLNSQAEYQDLYMNNLIDIIKSKNKRTAAWNEAAVTPHIDHGVGGSAGKIDKSCLIFSWEHSDVAKETTNNNFETILCPGHKTYFDMAHNNSTSERGICWAGTIEVKDIFDWNPVQDIENVHYIKGVQGQLWSETITNKLFFDRMINPRLATLSEVAWKGKISRSWIHFRSSLLNTVKLLEELGWRYHEF